MLLEGEDGADAERRIEHHEEPAEREVALARLGVDRDGAVEPRHRQVEVEEVANAGNRVGDPAVALVARIDRDAEEGDVDVIEEMAVGEDVVDRRPAGGVAGAAIEAEHDPAPGGHVHDEARVLSRALGEPRGGVAHLETMIGRAFRFRAHRRSPFAGRASLSRSIQIIGGETTLGSA